MERTLGCNVAMAARENKQQEMLQEVTKHLYFYLYFICVCICKKEELLLEFTRQAPSPPPLPVALQTTCFLDSRAFPEAPYFLRAP